MIMMGKSIRQIWVNNHRGFWKSQTGIESIDPDHTVDDASAAYVLTEQSRGGSPKHLCRKARLMSVFRKSFLKWMSKFHLKSMKVHAFLTYYVPFMVT